MEYIVYLQIKIILNKDYTKITRDDISDKCSYEKLHNIVGTLKNKFYEESGRRDRGLVSSIVFYSDGRTINGAESYDVSEKKDGSIKMYVSQNSENTSLLDLTIVANGKIAFPEDSSYLFMFYQRYGCTSGDGNLRNLQFNNSISTFNVTNMKDMFSYSKVTTLDLNSFNTSNVTNMSSMFFSNQATEIKGLNKFNTSKVTDMGLMFYNSRATALDLSSFDTSKVTNMSDMFEKSQATTLDLSSFNTSNVTNMSSMFSYSAATTGYAKDADTAAKFNDSSVTNIPDTLKFTVK